MDHDWEQLGSPFSGKTAPVRCRVCGAMGPPLGMGETEECMPCDSERTRLEELEELSRRYVKLAENYRRRPRVDPGHSGGTAGSAPVMTLDPVETLLGVPADELTWGIYGHIGENCARCPLTCLAVRAVEDPSILSYAGTNEASITAIDTVVWQHYGLDRDQIYFFTRRYDRRCGDVIRAYPSWQGAMRWIAQETMKWIAVATMWETVARGAR